MPQIPTLVLSPSWNVTQSVDVESYTSPLGDNYQQQAAGGDRSDVVKWRITRYGLTTAQKEAVSAELTQYAGVDNFLWSPHPSEPASIYTCINWTVSEDGVDSWRIEAEFLEDGTGECIQLLEQFDEAEIRAMLAGMLSFIQRYIRDTQPNLISTAGLVTNAFHDVLGRGGYFPGSSGTSEGQFAMIRACLIAFEETGMEGYKNVALLCASALEPILYGRPVPIDTREVWLCNWLFNLSPSFPAKGKYNSDYLKYGYFDQVVTFNNGVAVIPSTAGIDGQRLSDVYSVYPTTARLYYKNVYAPVVFGQPFQVDYWVSNYFLRGQNYRIFPTTASSAGTTPVATGETAGTIRLTTNYSGQAKVTYAAYDNARTIPVNTCFEAYPMWRQLDPGEIAFAVDSAWWAWDAYDLLYTHTNLDKWRRAKLITQNNVADLSVIPNLTHWYKKEDDEDPFAYPGTQVIKVVNGVAVETGYTVSRATVAPREQTIRVDVTSNPQSAFPSVELQNFVVNAQITDDVTIRAEATSNIPALAEIVLSTNPDPLNFSQLYTATWLLPGNQNTLYAKTFQPEDFMLWSKDVVWWPRAATDPIYVYSGLGGSATRTTVQDSIITGDKTLSPVVYRIDLDRGNGGYGGAGFVLAQKQIRRPPRMYFKSTGSPVRLRITDGAGKRWAMTLENTSGDWTKRTFDWSQFESEDDEETPNTEQSIRNIEFETIDGGSNSSIWVYWLASDVYSEPKTLETPVVTYKGSIVFRIAGTDYSFWVGTFRPVGSPSDVMRWNPGVVPFTWNIRDGSILAWQGAGAPSSGYQSMYHWFKFGKPEYADQVGEFLTLGQNWFANETGANGLFAPTYYRNYWDGAEYAQGEIDQFGYDFADPNFGWIGYQTRVLETTARYLHANPTDKVAAQITSRGLNFYRNHFVRFGTNQPPTNIIKNAYPLTLYNEPHSAALIARAALYANMAGVSPSVSFGVLARCYDYVKSQYVSDTGSTMYGSFSLGQPAFTENGGNYREWFGFWQAEICEFLALLLRYKDQLRTPPCGTLI